MIRIVVDANIIISALLGGSARFILFDPQSEDRDFEKVAVPIKLLKTKDFF
jgi:hypothetical protein